ncbi:Uncharacterised protein [Mycobacteroides abscessus subsp. abscessus]|nr:Uncharacterised protein [Mycobacteroides abscessus subsp. abscessus]
MTSTSAPATAERGSAVTDTEAPVVAATFSASATYLACGANPLGAAMVTWIPAVTPPSINEWAILLAPSPRYVRRSPSSEPLRSASVCRSASTWHG